MLNHTIYQYWIVRMMRSFLWEGVGDDRRDHLVSWEQVSRLRSKEGLAIGNLVIHNISIVGNLFYRFLLEPNS